MPIKTNKAIIRKERTPAKRKADIPKRAITFSDLIKFIGVLAVFIPLMTVILQYRQSFLQKKDENFRSTVEKLYSEDTEKRLAAASSLGTFVIKGKRYYNEALDLLINRLSLELDYNVLNAIRGSLNKIEKKEEFRKIIEKLLSIERNFWKQEPVLDEWQDKAKEAYEESKERFLEEINLIDNNESNSEREILCNLKKEMNLKWQIYYDREKDYYELDMHQRVIWDFLATFLRVTKYQHIERLIFSQNRFDDVGMVEVDLSNSDIKYSSFNWSEIDYSKFDNSFILHTTFDNVTFLKTSFVDTKIILSFFILSTLNDVDFTGTVFKEVFFIGSDLTGAKYNNTEGLKPIHFYETENVDKAIFDPAFKKELDEKLGSITEDEFIRYFDNITEFTEWDIERAHDVLNELKKQR